MSPSCNQEWERERNVNLFPLQLNFQLFFNLVNTASFDSPEQGHRIGMRRRILLPRLSLSLESVSLSEPDISSTHLGTAFELISLSLLSSNPYNYHLTRVGGANDKGLDLRGRLLLSSSSPSTLSTKSLNNSQSHHQVLVQCKASITPIRPAIIRELEGVLSHHFPPSSSPSPEYFTSRRRRNTPAKPLGILVALNGFSKQTLNRSSESRWPLSLVHLKVARDKLRLNDQGSLEDKEIQIQVVSWNRNKAWKELVRDDEFQRERCGPTSWTSFLVCETTTDVLVEFGFTVD